MCKNTVSQDRRKPRFCLSAIIIVTMLICLLAPISFAEESVIAENGTGVIVEVDETFAENNGIVAENNGSIGDNNGNIGAL